MTDARHDEARGAARNYAEYRLEWDTAEDVSEVVVSDDEAWFLMESFGDDEVLPKPRAVVVKWNGTEMVATGTVSERKFNAKYDEVNG